MRRVLLIDDDLGVRKVLRRILHQAGHEVVEGENGVQGIAQLRSSNFDVVLTDIVMPVMGGIEFIRFVRGLCPSLKIVAMSGGGRRDNMDYLEVARQQGATALLHKPFTPADVRASIDQCFETGAPTQRA